MRDCRALPPASANRRARRRGRSRRSRTLGHDNRPDRSSSTRTSDTGRRSTRPGLARLETNGSEESRSAVAFGDRHAAPSWRSRKKLRRSFPCRNSSRALLSLTLCTSDRRPEGEERPADGDPLGAGSRTAPTLLRESLLRCRDCPGLNSG